ncbi:hypothetical protein AQUCO_04900162v1 [Aquilegia coerulea]|uniref:BRCT domain-containing protein n=1 Tax=Aquilegia coerulea TaxID=218851 RepID=A0A2G5CK74_AQUCA|nr:hypothetical protein AQUCO_04900162v1 [Aquilegia coerulea]PIA31669.1 hypothetical protein AQUCO_04900162v1 [Aquilegia coerulea]
MKFRTTVISHTWFEDCAKAGKRLPMRHYTMNSGQQAGLYHGNWEVPNDGEKESPLFRKKGNVLSDLSNITK